MHLNNCADIEFRMILPLSLWERGWGEGRDKDLAYRTKKELSMVRHGEIILYKLDFILSFHPVMTPQFAL